MRWERYIRAGILGNGMILWNRISEYIFELTVHLDGDLSL